MAITPADIEQLTFSPSKHGYDTQEVDTFLESLAIEVDGMLKKIAELKGRQNSAESQLQSAQAQKASLQQRVSELEGELASRPAALPAQASGPSDEYLASERQISQVLIVAQQSADKIVADAQQNADHVRDEAEQKAREVIRQALTQKQAELDEIDRLKASREDFRSEYKRLLQHFMDDADSVFPAVATPFEDAQADAIESEATLDVVPELAADADSTALTEPVTTAPVVGADEDFSDLD